LEKFLIGLESEIIGQSKEATMNLRNITAVLTIVWVSFTFALSSPSCARAQFGLSAEGTLLTNFEFQQKTHFEPQLQTNFEPSLPTSFGFNSKRSASNVRLSERLIQLQARLPEEQKYVQDVIALVEQKQLPETLVNEAFFYAVHRYGGPTPFPYFERILKIQSDRLKLTAPTFDRTVYSRERFKPQLFVQ